MIKHNCLPATKHAKHLSSLQLFYSYFGNPSSSRASNSITDFSYDSGNEVSWFKFKKNMV